MASYKQWHDAYKSVSPEKKLAVQDTADFVQESIPTDGNVAPLELESGNQDVKPDVRGLLEPVFRDPVVLANSTVTTNLLVLPQVMTSKEKTHTDSDRLKKGDRRIQPSKSQLGKIAFKPATMTSSSSRPKLQGFGTSGAPNGKAGSVELGQMMTAGTITHSSSSLGDKKALNSEVFASNPARTSVKKLVVDKNATSAELSSLFSKNTGKKSTQNALELPGGSPSNATTAKGRLFPKALPTPAPIEISREKTHTDADKLKKGDYWIQPSEAQEMFEGFKCGRVGYGTMEFLTPVYLTTMPPLKEIPGRFIIFDQRECVVYPDEQEKPPVGEGLNVPARIILENCWAVDKATREPIKDKDNPRHVAHLKKLKSIRDTTFENFDIKTGGWTFRVEHFSRYGLGDDDNDDEMSEQ